MKLWDKGIKTEALVMDFTVGNDRDFDRTLAPFDIIASMAHVIMLEKTGLISAREKEALLKSLVKLYFLVSEPGFLIDEKYEDIHSCIESLLTEELGDPGKKIHTARSRNDQVMTDLKLFYREEIIHILELSETVIRRFLNLSEEYRDLAMPGYTHMQVAMPSSFGLWFAAHAESITEDLYMLKAAFDFVNLNPLGSAAGYGSGFPIDRELTTRLLEFNNLHVNSIDAQFSRGKSEWFLLNGIASLASSLSRFNHDLVLFSGQNFGFVKLHDHFTTGSSIMPHKKNPDVAELIRARCNLLLSAPAQIQQLTGNLPSGYHRDFQILKEITFPAIDTLKNCLSMTLFLSGELEIEKDILDNEAYRHIGSVDRMNELVMKGVPYREAYQQIAEEIAKGEYSGSSNISTSHTGSINNLSNSLIEEKLDHIIQGFNKEQYLGFRERFIQKFN